MIDPEIDLSAYLKWLCSLGVRCNEVPELVSKINRYVLASFRLNCRVWLGQYQTGLSKRLMAHFDQKKTELQDRLKVIEEEYIRYVGSIPGTVYIPDEEERKAYKLRQEKYDKIIQSQFYFLPTIEEVETIQHLRLSGFLSDVRDLQRAKWFRPKNQLYQQKLDGLSLVHEATYSEGEPLSNVNRIAALNGLIKDIYSYDLATYLRGLLLPGADASTVLQTNISRVSEPLIIDELDNCEVEEPQHSAPALSTEKPTHNTLAILAHLCHESGLPRFGSTGTIKADAYEFAAPFEVDKNRFYQTYNKIAKGKLKLSDLKPDEVSRLRVELKRYPLALQHFDNLSNKNSIVSR
ncbi:hypothetical protein [Fibrella arboris]|uniref:hypothetical protein n=1 Tax=Fibrella arboris TaxID=3242486 RepID=UPI003522DEBD